MKRVNKKASKELGIGIIAFALLLLLGGILNDNPVNFNKKEKYIESREYNNDYPEENYLFYLEDFDLGKEQRITANYPNIELGAKEEFNSLFVMPYFELKANMFRNNVGQIRIVPTTRENLRELKIGTSVNQLSGDENLLFKINDQVVAQVPAESSYFPLVIRDFPQNNTFDLTVEIEKPAWYALFNWNTVELKDFRVIEVSQDDNERQKEFNFDVDNQKYLDELIVDLVVNCEVVKEYTESVEVKVNGYIIGNQNPNCISRYNRMTYNISQNVLNPEGETNVLELSTEGYYKMGYSIVKTYYNDQEKYKFNLQDFSEVFDVIMYGDFDVEVLDVEINNKRISLERNEIESILPYLRLGANEIEFRQKPLEIEEFVIESLSYSYYN